MSNATDYGKGLREVASGVFAYLQPDGGYGYSNAGLITGSRSALLVDTLIDLPRTREMLTAMRAVIPAAGISSVVNTHAHPDHTAGNELLSGAEIITSATTLAEMEQLDRGANPIRAIMESWQRHGDAGAYLHEVMGRRFAVHQGRQVMPSRVFEDQLTVDVGGREARLVRVGPAHTQGDVVVYLPAERVLFTGDVVFSRVHPLVTAGMADAWIAACERLLEWDIQVLVPGHGPVTDSSALLALAGYLRYLREESRERFNDGMDYTTAAASLDLGGYLGWADEERIVMTVAGFYESFGASKFAMADVLGAAWRYRGTRRRRGTAVAHRVDDRTTARGHLERRHHARRSGPPARDRDQVRCIGDAGAGSDPATGRRTAAHNDLPARRAGSAVRPRRARGHLRAASDAGADRGIPVGCAGG